MKHFDQVLSSAMKYFVLRQVYIYVYYEFLSSRNVTLSLREQVRIIHLFYVNIQGISVS